MEDNKNPFKEEEVKENENIEEVKEAQKEIFMKKKKMNIKKNMKI